MIILTSRSHIYLLPIDLDIEPSVDDLINETLGRPPAVSIIGFTFFSCWSF